VITRPYGHLARIGSISPAAINEIKPYEFYQVAPPGTTIAFAELTVKEVTQEAIDEALQLVVDAAKELRRMDVDFMVIAGTPMVTMKPPWFEGALVDRVREVAGNTPVATAQSMEVAALRHLGMQRLVVATPWGDEINASLDAYLRRAGFDVLETRGAGIPVAQRGQTPPAAAADLGAALLREYPEADGLYIACPNWASLPALPDLEARFGKPVVNGIVAFVWYPLTQLGRFQSMPGKGRLLESSGDIARGEAIKSVPGTAS
jgi:maleate cis-trans isomerase